MPSPNDDYITVGTARAMIHAAIAEANSKARIPAILSGAVEDLGSDGELDVAWVRMDQEASSSDPTQSDNWGAPGVIPTTRLGETNIGEQVRATFNGSAGASATRTSAEQRIILPFGAELTDPRIELDGTTGVIEFYGEGGAFVGVLDSTRWAIGDLGDDVTPPGARATLDPIGGMRLRSEDDVLVSILDQRGYSLRDDSTGLVVAEIKPGSMRLVDPTGTDDIEMVTSTIGTMPNPSYRSTPEVSPGTTLVVPSAPRFTSTPADDIEIGHVAAWIRNVVQAATYTPPAGWTERIDHVASPDDSTLAVSVATRNLATGTAGTFTSTQSNWQHGVGTHVVLRGGGPVSPSFRSETHETFFTTATNTTFNITTPALVAEGDILVAFVSMGNDGGSVPFGWTTPQGWVFLGANFGISGTAPNQSTLAVGAWAKLASASEPASQAVSIQMGAGRKTFHTTVTAIENAYLVPGGVHIRLAGHPIRRLLATNTLQAAAQQVADFQGIPQSFDHLEVIYDGESDIGTDTTRRIHLRINGDAGANYHRQVIEDGTITTGLAATSGMYLGVVNGATAGHRTSGQATLFDYASTDRERSMVGHCTWVSSGDIHNDEVVGYYNVLGTGINRVQVFVDTAGAGIVKFAAGSRCFLYGY